MRETLALIILNLFMGEFNPRTLFDIKLRVVILVHCAPHPRSQHRCTALLSGPGEHNEPRCSEPELLLLSLSCAREVPLPSYLIGCLDLKLTQICSLSWKLWNLAIILLGISPANSAGFLIRWTLSNFIFSVSDRSSIYPNTLSIFSCKSSPCRCGNPHILRFFLRLRFS